MLSTVRSDPLHETAGAGEVHRPHDPAVRQRVAVSVLHIGTGLVQVIFHEGDLRVVGAKRRAREREALRGAVERLENRGTPAAVVTGMVDLVQDHERFTGQRCQHRRGEGNLCIGGHDAVHVGGQSAIPGCPPVIEMQAHRRGRRCPLRLEVLGGCNDHHVAAGMVRQMLYGRGKRKGGLAGARSRHGQEVGPGRRVELAECVGLPRPQPDSGWAGDAGTSVG